MEQEAIRLIEVVHGDREIDVVEDQSSELQETIKRRIFSTD